MAALPEVKERTSQWKSAEDLHAFNFQDLPSRKSRTGAWLRGDAKLGWVRPAFEIPQPQRQRQTRRSARCFW